MAETGAVLLESCREAKLFRECFINRSSQKPPVSVTAKNFDLFKRLHDSANPGMYWTGERIGKDLGNWYICMREKAYVAMSLWGEVPEIFALEAATPDEGAELISVSAEFAFKEKKTAVLFMIDDGANIDYQAAQRVGFVICGRYAAYRGIVS